MIPAAHAVLDLAAAKHNLALVRSYAPNAKTIAVIKANGYGHGMLRIAEALADADAFAVARVDEGLRLRKAGIRKRIVVLEGFSYDDELDEFLAYQLDAVVHTGVQVDLLEKRQGLERLSVWLKLDSGMNRLGFKGHELDLAYQRLRLCPIVKQPMHWMTHLANADERQDDTTLKQIQCFNEAVSAYPGPRSIANSAGIISWRQALTDWVRPGIMLYGVSPFADQSARSLALKPVMSLRSRLIAVKPVAKGERVGYAGSWRCEQSTLLGVAAIGYGDGYPRYAQSGTPVLLNGRRVPLIGRVSMDMITLDLQTQPDAKVGDPVVLWGEDLPVEEIARCANTIPYTLVCGVTQRVRMVCENQPTSVD
jgi:alanine racemase